MARAALTLVLVSCVALASCGDARPRERARSTSGAEAPARAFALGETALLAKDVEYAVTGTELVVVNRGRGMTIEREGGHSIVATLDVTRGAERASLHLAGWTPQTFGGYSFAITGIGEKHGGTDVKIRVTRGP